MSTHMFPSSVVINFGSHNEPQGDPVQITRQRREFVGSKLPELRQLTPHELAVLFPDIWADVCRQMFPGPLKYERMALQFGTTERTVRSWEAKRGKGCHARHLLRAYALDPDLVGETVFGIAAE